MAVARQPDVYRPVTDARLRSPAPDDWLMYRRTYDGWGYSPLDQITTDNVASLRPVWSASTGVAEGHEAPALVNDGIMFVSTPQNQVLALDARTGEIRWRYRRQLPEGLLQFHPTNRGVGLYEDKVYVATVDAFVVALDAATGSVVWETAVEDHRVGYYMTMAPLVVNGKVMVGVSGGELGIRGFVTALDAESGGAVWKTYTIPGPDEVGHDSWPGDSWRTGGVPVWLTGTFDPELNLTYWGTGNAGPWIGDARPGDNLYSNSVIALDADTGALTAHHQYHWNGSWDWDEVAAPLLIDVERGGRTIKSLVHPGRNGYLWLLERSATDISFVDGAPFVRDGADHIGELQAWDLATGSQVWVHEFEFQNWGRDRETPLATADEFRHHRRTDVLHGRRRAVHRGPSRVGAGRAADAGRTQRKPGSQNAGAAGWRDLGVRPESMRR